MTKNQNSLEPLVNRVANSGLKVINLEEFYPQIPIEEIDIKRFLFKEMILKEKDFRAALKEIDWVQYKAKVVLIYNSNQAIIPVWAYMLLSSYLSGFATQIYQGTKEEYLKYHYKSVLKDFDAAVYDEDRVVIKGCSNKPVPPSAYAELTALLKPFAQSIMYGEPCSTVPIFKRPRKLTNS